MLQRFAFIARITFAWMVTLGLLLGVFGPNDSWLTPLVLIVIPLLIAFNAFTHVKRVKLLTPEASHATLANRQRQQLEIPFTSALCFSMIDAAIRGLPGCEEVNSSPDSLQGFIYLPGLVLISVASMSMAPVGARTSHRLPVASLKKVFALVLYGLAAYMLWKVWHLR